MEETRPDCRNAPFGAHLSHWGVTNAPQRPKRAPNFGARRSAAEEHAEHSGLGDDPVHDDSERRLRE